MVWKAAVLLSLLAGLAPLRAQTETVTVMQYGTADASAGSSTTFPGALTEYHCIVKNNNTPTYVKGTYGMYGYFEGPFVSATQATITFYEVTGVGNMPGRPISGAGLLTYTPGTFAQVTGPYWPVGNSDQADSALAGNWNATNGQSSNATQDSCLYSPTGKRAAQSPFVSRNVFSYNNADSTNVFCSAIRESDSTAGSILGSYTYKYTGEDCIAPCTATNNKEIGNYGEGAVSFTGCDAQGVATTWRAVSGPFAGLTGSSLYLVSSGGKKMAGFFCNTEMVGGELVRTSCFLENYSKASGSSTLQKCGAGYRSPTPQPKVLKLASGLSGVATGR